jgi:hypothetical protein
MGVLTVNEERDILSIMSHSVAMRESEARNLLGNWKDEARLLSCILEAPSLRVVWRPCTIHAIFEHNVVLRHVATDAKDAAWDHMEFQLTGAFCSFKDLSGDIDSMESGLVIEFPQPPLDVPQKVPRPNFTARLLVFQPFEEWKQLMDKHT